jgi:hypothetical protein
MVPGALGRHRYRPARLGIAVVAWLASLAAMHGGARASVAQPAPRLVALATYRSSDDPIASHSDRNGRLLCVMSADGSDQHHLTFTASFDLASDRSPERLIDLTLLAWLCDQWVCERHVCRLPDERRRFEPSTGDDHCSQRSALTPDLATTGQNLDEMVMRCREQAKGMEVTTRGSFLIARLLALRSAILANHTGRSREHCPVLHVSLSMARRSLHLPPVRSNLVFTGQLAAEHQ